MRKLTTILCSIAFMVSGIMMAITASDPSPSTGYKTMAAATMPDVKMPVFMGINDNPGIEALSEDLVRDLAKKKGVLDTVFITKTDTVKEQVTKVKWRKVPVPSPIMEIDVTAHRDTVLVPVYYLATQVGTKEGPTGECISVYEVHKVDEICTDTINSSVQPVTELDNDVGE